MHRTVTTASATTLLAIFCAWLPASAEIPGWALECSHSIYGKGKVFVSAQAVKIDNESSGRILISRGPDWKVAVFDKATHKYFVETADAYAHQKYTRVFSLVFDVDKTTPIRTNIHEPVGGVTTTRYICEAYSVDSGVKGKPNRKMEIQYSVADKLSLPQATCDAFARCSGLPRLPGLIMRLRYGRNTGIDTIACTRQSFPDSFFQYPKGYALGRNLQDVLFSVDAIKDMLAP